MEASDSDDLFALVADRMVDPRVQACLQVKDRVDGELVIDVDGSVSFVVSAPSATSKGLVACVDQAVQAGPWWPWPTRTARRMPVWFERLFDKSDGYAFSAPRFETFPRYVAVTFVSKQPVLLHRGGIDFYITGSEVGFELPRGMYVTCSEGVSSELEIDGSDRYVWDGAQWLVVAGPAPNALGMLQALGRVLKLPTWAGP